MFHCALQTKVCKTEEKEKLIYTKSANMEITNFNIHKKYTTLYTTYTIMLLSGQ